MKTLLALVCLMAFSACGTVTPRIAAPEAASFDGNAQTSGLLRVEGEGYVVTPHFVARYNALIAIYGRDFTVPLEVDSGLSTVDGQPVIDRQHLSKFLEMSAWSRSGLKHLRP